MSQIKIVKTNSNTFFFLDGKSYSISSEDNRHKQLLEAAEVDDVSRFRTILNPPSKLGSALEGRLIVYEDKATLDDAVLPAAISIRLREHVKAGKDLEPVLRFWQRIQANPSARAIEESWNFLSHRNMPVTTEGFFIGYKAIRNDYFSQFSGTAIPLQGITLQSTDRRTYHIRNMPGDVIELRRREVDDDKDRTCSYGLHVGSIEYVRSFMARQGRIVTVLVDPADIVSVPSDCNGQKVRVCKYTVLGELEGKELSDVLDTHERISGFDYNNEAEEEEDWDFDSDFEDEDDEEFDEIPTSVIAAMEDYPTVSCLSRLSLDSLDDLINMVSVEISIEEIALAGIKNMQVTQEAWLEDSRYSGLEKTIEDTLERLDEEEQKIHSRICSLEDYLELVTEAERIRRSGN